MDARSTVNVLRRERKATHLNSEITGTLVLVLYVFPTHACPLPRRTGFSFAFAPPHPYVPYVLFSLIPLPADTTHRLKLWGSKTVCFPCAAPLHVCTRTSRMYEKLTKIQSTYRISTVNADCTTPGPLYDKCVLRRVVVAGNELSTACSNSPKQVETGSSR